MAIPEPNDTYSKAFNVGPLTAPKTYTDSVGGTDLYDFYKISLTQNATLTINLTGLTNEADVAIVSDLNGDGVFSTSEVLDYTNVTGTGARTLIADLGTGAYYVVVTPDYIYGPQPEDNTNYTLKLSPQAVVGVVPVADPGATYLSSFNVGALTSAKTYKQFVGGKDLGDFYKISLTKNSTVKIDLTGLRGEADVAVVSDLNGDGVFSTSEVLDYTNVTGTGDRTLISDLGTGTYYVVVTPDYVYGPQPEDNTNYTLKLTPQAVVGVVPVADPGATYLTAFNVGPLTSVKTYKQFVGGKDLGDFYKISVPSNSTVTISLTGLRSEADVAVVSDNNGDGVFSISEVLDYTNVTGTGDRALISDLGTGTYYVVVTPDYIYGPQPEDNTNYTLKLTPKAVVGVVPVADPGATYLTAFNVGALTSAKTYKQFVGGKDLGDFYKISLTKNSTVTISLTGLRSEADVAVVSDNNGDGVFSTSEVLDYTNVTGTGDRALISDLGTGTYYVVVTPDYIYGPQPEDNTNYTLKLSPQAVVGVVPVADPGATYLTAFNVGALTSAKTYKQFVGGKDLGDFYKISLTGNRTVTISLTGLRGEADVAIASDSNGDGLFSTSEVLDYTNVTGTGDRALVADLGTGTYYVVVTPDYVYGPQSEDNTNYTLNLSTVATRNGTQKIVPKKQKVVPKSATPKSRQKQQQQPPQKTSLLPSENLFTSRSEVQQQSLEQQLPGMPAHLITQSVHTHHPPIMDGSALQALNPSCDALMLGAALLTLGAKCLPWQ